VEKSYVSKIWGDVVSSFAAKGGKGFFKSSSWWQTICGLNNLKGEGKDWFNQGCVKGWETGGLFFFGITVGQVKKASRICSLGYSLSPTKNTAR